MSDLSLTRRRFINILTSPACQKIDFWCGGMHVSGAGFTLVAHALGLGGVRKGKGIGISIEKMEKGAAAAYDQFINAFVVPRRSWARTDAFERLAVVHEAVHALRDIQGRTLTYEGKSFRPRGADRPP
ncbi:hypothetical protein [Muricoccus radiodurans]|uniref:hypothetical protein n=1 Tax=Muricoccus radiodurans TaxID=2231721 RepID=UPI003CED51CE